MGAIVKRATRDAAKLVKVETAEHAVFMIGGQIVLAIVLWFAQDDAGLWTRIGSAAVPFLLYPAALAWKLVTVPPLIIREREAEIAGLKASAALAGDRRATREWLGLEMERARQLMAKCADMGEPSPEDDAQAWSEAVEDRLAADLDMSYVARFRDSSGVPMQMSSITDDQRRRLHGNIRIRSHNLNLFIRELT